jgi:hypothetical protein
MEKWVEIDEVFLNRIAQLQKKCLSRAMAETLDELRAEVFELSERVAFIGDYVTNHEH